MPTPAEILLQPADWSPWVRAYLIDIERISSKWSDKPGGFTRLAHSWERSMETAARGSKPLAEAWAERGLDALTVSRLINVMHACAEASAKRDDAAA